MIVRHRGGFEGGFDILDDFLGENVGVGKIVGFVEGFIPEPEDVEAGSVTVDKLPNRLKRSTLHSVKHGNRKLRMIPFSARFPLSVFRFSIVVSAAVR